MTRPAPFPFAGQIGAEALGPFASDAGRGALAGDVRTSRSIETTCRARFFWPRRSASSCHHSSISTRLSRQPTPGSSPSSAGEVFFKSLRRPARTARRWRGRGSRDLASEIEPWRLQDRSPTVVSSPARISSHVSKMGHRRQVLAPPAHDPRPARRDRAGLNNLRRECCRRRSGKGAEAGHALVTSHRPAHGGARSSLISAAVDPSRRMRSADRRRQAGPRRIRPDCPTIVDPPTTSAVLAAAGPRSPELNLGGECLAIHARQLVVEPDLSKSLRRHRR